MTILLEQLADEAIRLRWEYIRAVESVPPSLRDEIRAERLATWAWINPALDALAVERETTLGELEAKGITPDQGCTARVATVQLHAVPLTPTTPQRYRLGRLRANVLEPVGLAWLSTTQEGAGPGRYLALDTTGTYPGHVYGDTLHEAVERLAGAICRVEQLRRAARRGDVQ